MSTSSSQNDDQPSRDFFGHGLSQTLASPNPLQQQQPHLQNFLSTNSNIALQQQTAVIQQQTALASSPLSTAPASQNLTPGSLLQAPPHSSQFVHWPNPLMTNASFLQPQPQPTQSPDVQQQQLNDFLFNIHAQAAYAAAAATVPTAQVPSATTQQETYTVLRVGKGNFLKIYHCPENAMGNMPGETSFGPMPSYNHTQHANFHHASPQGATAIQSTLQQQQQSQSKPTGTANSPSAPVFNSYELFSSSTFTQLPTAEMPPLVLLGPTAEPQTIRTEDIRNCEQVSNIETSNMIVQNMPNNNKNNNNWTCGNHVVATRRCIHNNQEENEVLTHSFVEAEDTLTKNNVSNVDLEMTPNDHNAIQHCPQQQTNLQDTSLPKDNVNQTLPTSDSTVPLVLSPTLKNEIPRQEAPKKRIVAEVKPMRMTYSDVLSKLNNQTQNSQQNNYNNSSVKTSTSTTSVLASQRNQQKSLKVDSNIANNSRRLTDDATATRTSCKKSPMHENKENQQQQQIANNKLNNQKRSQTTIINCTNNNFNSNNNIGSISNKSATQKNFVNSKNINPIKSNCNGSNNIDNQHSKKPRSNKNSDIQNNGGKNCSLLLQRCSGTNSSTSPTNNYNSANNTYARKPKFTNSGNLSSSTSQHRSRYQNNTNASYSYSSTRRSRNNMSYGTASLNNSSSVNGTGSNRNYELVKLFLRTWYTYTLKILIWLFYLVYDIVVLGCSILYERLLFAYNSGKTYGKQLYKELKENSNKPGVWFKNYCRKFDAKFSKTSKWAFWRKFFKKNPPQATSESIKTGRLPATGDEAMHQLLNCKGKDAYSILGVPPNSSQEQIRKHYKKIAVLVHPDKNKQAGAEEAFKVLQRAFELIGEPENRHAYDQSLAEALHAEKAWTELHDLLSQLQTKITEAANTIRCSTCGLRHPRKITERPHYAARECTSCKIRHSAREGDIWAETSMLGLRWKYLALMEGKVYDITEWANCQKGALAHLEPNSHMVQYRIVRGAQHQHQQKQQAQHQQHQQQRTGSQYPGTAGVSGKFKRDNIPPSEASLHEFLDNLYSGQHPQQQQNTSANAGSSRRRNRRN